MFLNKSQLFSSSCISSNIQQNVLHHIALTGCVCDQAPNEHVAPELVVGDHFAAAQVLDTKPEESVTLVSLEHSGVCVSAVVRGATTRVDEICPVTLVLEPPTNLLGSDDCVLSQFVPLLLHLEGPGRHVVLGRYGQGEDGEGSLENVLTGEQVGHLLPEQGRGGVSHQVQHVARGQGGEEGEDGGSGTHKGLGARCVLDEVVGVVEGVDLLLLVGWSREQVKLLLLLLALLGRGGWEGKGGTSPYVSRQAEVGIGLTRHHSKTRIRPRNVTFGNVDKNLSGRPLGCLVPPGPVPPVTAEWSRDQLTHSSQSPGRASQPTGHLFSNFVLL